MFLGHNPYRFTLGRRGISQLKVFVAPFKRARPDPVVRFETAPGEQLQADFTYVRKGKEPLLAFVATLGYCRATLVRFTRDESATTLVECVRAALAYFGGVPKEILYDNPKTVVIERDAYGEGEHRVPARSAGPVGRVQLPDLAVSAVPGEDEGQGRAVQRVPEEQLSGAAGGDAEAVLTSIEN